MESIQERLGRAPGDRMVVVHVDDVGMSSAANRGALRALEGAATCGSVMVPCPAFDEIAEIARGRTDLDLGVHLTLNAEYETYRWATVASGVAGLVSPDGGMWRTTAETVQHASKDEVERELRAQVEKALAAGIDVTHLDSHMGTVFDLKFVEVYVALARDYKLPIFIPRVDRKALQERGLADALASYLDLIDAVEDEGFPVFDHFCSDSLSFPPGTGAEHNRSRLGKFDSGLGYLITHCAEGGEELEGITRDWRQRDEEHHIYSDGTMAAAIEESGLSPIGMRALRDLVRAD